MNYDSVIDGILKREGGYVDRAEDKGGPTNHGITQQTLADWRGRPVSKEDMKALTESEARAIYTKEYIVGPGFDKITDPTLFDFVVDCAVNHGPGRARGWYDAVSKFDPHIAFLKMVAARIKFYGRIVSNDKELANARAAGFKLQAVFAAGWLNRTADFLETHA